MRHTYNKFCHHKYLNWITKYFNIQLLEYNIFTEVINGKKKVFLKRIMWVDTIEYLKDLVNKDPSNAHMISTTLRHIKKGHQWCKRTTTCHGRSNRECFHEIYSASAGCLAYLYLFSCLNLNSSALRTANIIPYQRDWWLASRRLTARSLNLHPTRTYPSSVIHV